MEAMQQQMQMDDTKLYQSNSVAYGRPADPTVLKVNTLWAVAPTAVKDCITDLIDGHISPAHWKIQNDDEPAPRKNFAVA
eukprot:3781689-Karenia_brevis.AAC.1